MRLLPKQWDLIHGFMENQSLTQRIYYYYIPFVQQAPKNAKLSISIANMDQIIQSIRQNGGFRSQTKKQKQKQKQKSKKVKK
jgi:hypothetical protein